MTGEVISFKIDHEKLMPGIYVHDIKKINGHSVTTYDFRFKRPNHGEYLTPCQAHTIEHVMATFFTENMPEKIYFGPMGCFAKGTKVLMFDGSLKEVQDICVGDKVMGPDSKPRTVLNLIRGKDKLYRVVQAHAKSYLVNGKHTLSLCYNRTEKRYGCIKGDIIDITVEDYLNKSEKFKECFSGIKYGYEGSTVELEIDPYILGLWLGDGVRSKVRLCVSDLEPELAEQWIKYGESLGLECYVEEDKGRSKQYSLVSKKSRHNILLDKIRKLDLYKNKHIPEVYFSSSREQRLQLLAGLINTDGWCSKRSGTNRESLGINFANKQLAYDTKRLADSLGYGTHLSLYKKGKPMVYPSGKTYIQSDIYSLSIVGTFEDLIPYLLEKKRPSSRNNRRDYRLSRLTIMPEEEGEYYGFEIDGDQRFLLSDGTLVHNCLTGFYLVVDGIHNLDFVLSRLSELDEYWRGLLADNWVPAKTPVRCGNYKLLDIKEGFAAWNAFYMKRDKWGSEYTLIDENACQMPDEFYQTVIDHNVKCE